MDKIVRLDFDQSDREWLHRVANQSHDDEQKQLIGAVYRGEGEKARRGRPTEDWACRYPHSSQTKKLKLNMTKTALR